jgi:hypothetical protein
MCVLLLQLLWPCLIKYDPVVEGQYQDLIHSSDAWEISDDAEGSPQATALRSTNSARRIKALFEQVTGKCLSLRFLTASQA